MKTKNNGVLNIRKTGIIKPKEKIKSDNRGFTLIELLISISILAIVLLPLLNNFVTAAKVNAKSKRMQNETVLAQNILEEIKALDVKEIAARYNYPEDFPSVNGDMEEMVLKNGHLETASLEESSSIRNTKEDGTYEYEILNKRDKPYYFARKNISMGGRKYDALITLDGTAYLDGETAKETAYNSFQMPVFSDLNPVNNLLVLQSFEEETAINTLYSNHIIFNQELESVQPPVTPIYATKDQIKSNLKKEIEIAITGYGTYDTTVTFHYFAPGISGAGSVSYTLGSKNLDVSKGSIYIFFFPSSENTLTIHKDSLITDPIDIYAINQKSALWTGDELTVKDNIIPSGIHLYSNSSQIKNLSGGNDLVKKGQAKNRIYKVQVELYTAGSNFTSDALCNEFTSTKEE